MTSKGFVFLLLVTIATVMIAGTIAEQFTEVGLMRTLVVAAFTAAVVFPAAKYAERRGWIKGSVRIDKLKDEFKRPGANAEVESPATAVSAPSAATSSSPSTLMNPGDKR